MKYNIIACVNDKLALGKNNQLLYSIKDDMKRFVSLTTHNIVIMGRKTYESIPNAPLKNRLNIIISSNKEFFIEPPQENVIIVHSIDEAIEYCETFEDILKLNNENIQAYVIGGASIYSAFIEKGIINEAFITKVNATDDGDAYFPDIFNNDNWETTHESAICQNDGQPFSFQFLTLRNKNNDN